MVRKLLGKTGIASLVSWAALTRTVFAQSSGANNPTSPISLPNPINATSFTQVAANFTTLLIEIAIPLTAIMAIIGGFQMITAAGNPEKFSSGRKTLTYAVIGFVIVVFAGGIVALIRNFLNS